MSYWIYLECEHCGQTLPFGDAVEEGGTYAIGGVYSCELNVTSNYARFFDFRVLDTLKAEHTAAKLAEKVEELGTERSADYWEPTPENAGAALSTLLAFAVAHPEGRWRVS